MLRRPPDGPSSLLSLGALAAGFGLFHADALAQSSGGVPDAAAPAAAASAASAARGGAAPSNDGATLQPTTVRAKVETDRNSLRATTTTVGRGNQDLRDVPQSTTIVTEKLLDDRRTDTVREALHYTAGISFQAAEGGEEDIRLRGFSLTASGDIYADNVRDPAFYDRDVFNFDRIELLRGSASMLFGRGSTGGVVNQVSKQPLLANAAEISTTVGSGSYFRGTGDFSVKLSESAAARLNVMTTSADHWGNAIDKVGIAASLRWGIKTADEFVVSYYWLDNRNGVNYGLPWLRSNDPGAISASNPGVLIPVDPKSYYGAASDYNAGYASFGTVQHIHRFGDGGQLHTTLRHGGYDRDLRASAIRFCVRTTNPTTGVVTNPDCPTTAPTLSTISPATPLVRGTNNKVQDLTTTYLQSDYAKTSKWLGRNHEVLAGVDVAREEFNNSTLSVPAGTVLDKNTPRPVLGIADDGTAVDESARVRSLNRNFVAKALGFYAQDLVEVVPHWKLLAGLRWDRFEGKYASPGSATLAEASRSDSLWSRRFGVLWQPTETMTYYASYGTSFNTSGELYNYDLPGSKAPPEKSRNVEVGARIDLFDGRLSSRVAAFQTTKYHERNRDSPEGQPITDFILSGRRHANGVELDLAGRITPAWEMYLSYAWIPSAKIDEAAFGVAPSGERVGDRPSLTPRHSGSLFTTYQVVPAVRVGGGVNARSSQTPNRNPVGIVAPGYLTYDLFAEYEWSPEVQLKLNVINATNKLYADSLYTGHYVPGTPRSVYATLTLRF